MEEERILYRPQSIDCPSAAEEREIRFKPYSERKRENSGQEVLA